MPRKSRLHVSGGMYYVFHRSDGLTPIFREPADYGEFELIFSAKLKQYGMRVHAFSWLPNEIHMILQVGDNPLSNFMRTLNSRYVQRHLHIRELFRGRPCVVLFDPAYLRHFVRYVHLAACAEEQSRISGYSSNSSHGTYLGEVPTPWLTTSDVLRSFSPDLRLATEQYRKFMKETVESSRINGFELRTQPGSQVLGGSLFLSSLPRHLQIRRTNLTIDDIVNSVLLQQGMSREDVFSQSAKRATSAVTLTRSLIAFHAVARHIATYTRIASLFGLSSSTLTAAVKCYNVSNPELFELNALMNSGPLLPIPEHTSLSEEANK